MGVSELDNKKVIGVALLFVFLIVVFLVPIETHPIEFPAEIYVSSEENLPLKDVITVIMGSSTIYPFIKPHFYKGDLLLDGGIATKDFSSLFKGMDKGLIIEATRGRTRVKGKYLRIF